MPPMQFQLGSPRAWTRLRWLVSGVVIGLLLVPMAAWASHQFSDVPSSSPAHRSVTAVADAGLMTGSEGRFYPGRAVTRASLAQVLHRGLHRVSVDRTIADIPMAQQDPPTIAAANMGIDGYQRGSQGVLLTLNMQVEVAQRLDSECVVTLQATSWPENFDVGASTFKMFAGERGASVGATFLARQSAGTLYTYEITADSTCSQPLHVISGALTAQSAAFTGNGSHFQD